MKLKNLKNKIIFLLLIFNSTSYADTPKVLSAKINCNNLICNLSVKVKHEDDSWDHYVNKWEVYENDKLIATRVLRHPHIDEQPFTRSLKDIKINPKTQYLIIKSYDSIHGYSNSFKVTIRK